MGFDPETNIDRKELPSPQDQLLVVQEFISGQLADVVPYQDSGSDAGIQIDIRDGPTLRLTDGSSISCASHTVIRGDSQGYSKVNIDVTTGLDASLYFNGDGTYDITASKGSEQLYDEADLTPEEAAENPDFVGLVESIYRVIIEEIPKPKRVFPRFPLPVAVVFVDQADEVETLTAPVLEVGVAEQPVKGQDAALIDKARALYGVFDGESGHESQGQNSEIAARLAATTVQRVIVDSHATTPEEAEATMIEALKEAHITILGWSESDESLKPGSTTATLAQVVRIEGEDYLVWASVGDTRLYLKTEGAITQVSKDEGSGRTINNALGKRGAFNGVKQHGIIKLPAKYELVLCSDGITGDKGEDIMQDDEILQASEESDTAQAAAQKLLDISRKFDDKVVAVARSQEALAA